MTKNFPNLVKDKDTQVQEAQRVPYKLDQKRPTLRHVIIKMTRLKNKERILKATREKQVFMYKGAPTRLSSDFSTETFQARGNWCEICKVIKIKGIQPRLLCPTRLSFKTEGEIKSLPDKKKLKEFITCKPVLHEMLKCLL